MIFDLWVLDPSNVSADISKTLSVAGYFEVMPINWYRYLWLFFRHCRHFHCWLRISIYFLIPHSHQSSLQNPKNFRTCEPFKFSNVRFFYPYWLAEKFSNATFFHQTVSQNLPHKNLWNLSCLKSSVSQLSLSRVKSINRSLSTPLLRQLKFECGVV